MTVMRQSSAEANFESSRAARKARSSSGDFAHGTAIFLNTASPVGRGRARIVAGCDVGIAAPRTRYWMAIDCGWTRSSSWLVATLAGGVVEPFEDGGLESDAVVAETVVGVEVGGGDGRAGLLECGDESFVGGAEAVVGGDVEDGARCDLCGERGKAPGGDVRLGFVLECGGRGAG